MYKYKAKGSALIVAVMVSLILAITTLGFMSIVRFSSDQASQGYNDMRLFWAAESGANHALKWIKRLKCENFSDATNSNLAKKHFNETNKLKKFTLYASEGAAKKITVNLSLGYDATNNEWSITSRAVQSNGDDVTVKLEKIKPVNPAKYAYGMTSGTVSTMFRYQGGDTFDGEFYSSGGLHFNPASDSRYRPRFNGKVSLSKQCWDGNTASKSYTTSITNHNLIDYIVPWMLKNDMYRSCLNATTDRSDVLPDDNEASFLATMKDIFPSGIQVVDAMDAAKGVSLSYEELRDDPPTNIKCYPVAGTSAKQITFYIEGSKTKANIDGTIVVMGPTTYNTILVSGNTEIKINGTVATDVCVVTEKNDVTINGDIKYENINYPTPTYTPEDSTMYREIQREIDRESTPKFSILAGVSENAALDDGQINIYGNGGQQHIYVSASIFAPKGKLARNGVVPYDVKAFFIGSVLINDKSGWHGGKTQNFTGIFYGDTRYKDAKTLPLGYLFANGTGFINDQINLTNTNYNWKVTY